MLDDASHKILDYISSHGEYSFRLHSITANNVPEIQSTEFRLVMEVQKITRCKDCFYGITGHGITGVLVLCAKPYATDTVGGAMHRYDWFCSDGKEKDEQENQEEKV